MASVGLDPYRYLYCEDPIERMMLVELYNRTVKNAEMIQENLAIQIANQVGKLFKK